MGKNDTESEIEFYNMRLKKFFMAPIAACQIRVFKNGRHAWFTEAEDEKKTKCYKLKKTEPLEGAPASA